MVLTELHHRGHNHMDTDLLSKFEHKIVSSSRNVKVVLSLRLTDCHCRHVPSDRIYSFRQSKIFKTGKRSVAQEQNTDGCGTGRRKYSNTSQFLVEIV